MFYAIVYICESIIPLCDFNHISYMMQTGPVFDTFSSCMSSMQAWINDTPLIGLKDGVDYTVNLSCLEVS